MPDAPNRLNRELTVSFPNKVWVSDITYIQTDEGWFFIQNLVYEFRSTR
ncbi:hypothetical protein NTG1052_240012 [Candidatus Nitrotoga sp. 1052]|nr:hypothetical protein NTG1052_240012 [Candidatus Nitrotoga sp. 1052]